MLKIYRRHVPECKHASKGTRYNKCGCPIWVDGMHAGKRSRYSLDTFNWEEANKTLMKLTAGENPKDCTVEDAVKDFIADCERRGLAEGGVKKYRELLNQLSRFCDTRAITEVRALDLHTLSKFVEGLTDSTLVQAKKIERLRTFGHHCMKKGWTEANHAAEIKKPKVTNPPVEPFTEEQQQAILAAIEKYPQRNSFGYDNRARMRAFVLTLRYTGFRMSDVMKLHKGKIDGQGRVFIRTTKTNTPISLPLPQEHLDALKAIERQDSPYYFTKASSKAKPKSALTIWGESFSKLLEIAKVKGHPHMYRHTLACDLLSKGIPVETVAAILGNSPAIVQKHYAPWIKSRQDALDTAIKKLWTTE